MSAQQNKDYVRDSEIDHILAQVQKKRASASGEKPQSAANRKSRDAELDEIMRGLGFDTKRPEYMDPILLPDPAENYTKEERASVRAQMNLPEEEEPEQPEAE